MTKVEAQGITDLMHELTTEWHKAKDEDTKQMYLGWIKRIETEYAKAQKVLARYNK